MRILLTAINAKYIHSNLAVYSLKAYAGDPDTEIAEYTINQPVDQILMDLYERRPDVLCFSCYIWNLEYVERLVREYAKLQPGVPVWLGGPEVSYDAGEVLARLPQVKGVMKGEGEETFRQLCKAYHSTPFVIDDLEGVTFRDETGRIHENPWRPAMDPDRIPFVYEDLDCFENKIIYYESSRGCPFSCSYCLSSVDKKLRFRSLELVKRELQFLIDREVPQVKFVDRTFNCSHGHALEIWRYIRDHDRGKTNFHFEVAADILNEEELELLGTMRPGLVQLEIGVQSVHPDTIREIRRTMNFERVCEVVDRIRSRGNIHQHLDLIAGLPFEDLPGFQRSFDAVYALRPDQLQLGFLKVLKGSYMKEQEASYGLVYQSHPPYELLYTRWLSYEDIICLKGVEEMVEVYYNSRQFTHTMERLVQEYDSAFGMYKELWQFYRHSGLSKLQHRRSARYEILLQFIRQGHPDKTEPYRELLIYDYYLRENAKSRPEFAGEYQVSARELREFYEREEARRQYLPRYGDYDRNQMRKMTHLEYFPYAKKYILFDYMEKNPLNHEARTCMIEK